MGANVFPVIFLGLFAIRPVPTELAKGRLTELPMCIPPPWPPRASANVLGTVNAIASAIVVYFMAISFTCETPLRGRLFRSKKPAKGPYHQQEAPPPTPPLAPLTQYQAL